ncbi:acylphosphatase [Vagococcus sp. PNs007]|uniref:acylphosphatase n=1 Tax=Vagococcus proximus TaxID=2991417 RepID=A0ABT5WYJ7_9ENTE|nr:acylphosphatase [Vagococcus proximus]MDF0478828.1 acylphosphatase [Vagococcus proximus]
MNHVKLTVQGRVQHVGFRITTKMVADRLRIKGIVKNLPDGSVYIEATGDETKLKKFISLVEASPTPSGRVDNVIINFVDVLPNYTAFDVTY